MINLNNAKTYQQILITYFIQNANEKKSKKQRMLKC